MRIITIVLALLAASLAHAQSTGPKHLTLPAAGAKLLLNNVALNGAAGTRTFVWDGLSGLTRARFFVFFDYTAQAGTITLACTISTSTGEGATALTSSTNVDYFETVCSSVSSTACTLATPAAISWVTGSLSADTRYTFPWDLHSGVRSAECVATHGGTPGATDKLTVYGLAGTE